jgi:Icc-related predicted phosphoesterase
LSRLRIFFATDLHASERCFRKFLNAAKAYGANVLILGGDVTGKMVVPIVEHNGQWKSTFMGVETLLKSSKELGDFESLISNSGYYPYRTNPSEMEEFTASPAGVHDLFMKLMLGRIEAWVRLAEERLASTGVKIFITGGNDDPVDIEPILNSSKFVVNPEGRVVDLDQGIEMVSSGYGNITPWKCPRDVTEDVLLQKIGSIASLAEDPARSVFNLHVPPYDSGLDLTPKLDDTLRPVSTPGMGVATVPVGSTAVRTVIEKYQPMLGIHGHIHESRGTVKIGRTLCINPGSEYGEGILRGVLIDIDEKAIKSYVFTTG